MLNIFKKFWAWLKNLTLEEDDEEQEKEVKDIPLYLPVNGLYVAWIESIERQIDQVKIDYALGSISKEVYEDHFKSFQDQVKQLSTAYARELLIYSA